MGRSMLFRFFPEAGVAILPLLFFGRRVGQTLRCLSINAGLVSHCKDTFNLSTLGMLEQSKLLAATTLLQLAKACAHSLKRLTSPGSWNSDLFDGMYTSIYTYIH